MNFLELALFIVPLTLPFTLYSTRTENVEAKKWVNTVLGLVFSCIMMWKYYVWYYFLTIIICLSLIKLVGWRKCHLVTTALVFLSYFGYQLMIGSLERNTITIDGQYPGTVFLKLIALSFDIHITNRRKYATGEKKSITLNNAEDEPLEPTFGELFHYTFSFATIISGALIRYRTYHDYLHLPFSRSCKRGSLLVRKLFIVSGLSLTYFLLSNFFPIGYTLTEEFRGRHFLYKNMYNFLILNQFKAHLCSFTGLLELSAVALGMGAYPTSLESVNCRGPQKDYSHFKNISREEAEKLEYDFETVSCQDLMLVFFCPWHAISWRSYNKSVQYFMGTYFYSEFFGGPSLKKYRTVLTMLVSAFWHGLAIGWYVSLGLCGVFIVAERSYYKIWKYTSGWASNAYLAGMWLIQAHIFSHVVMSMIHLRLESILAHASAMNYVPYISLLIYFVTGKVVLRCLEAKNPLKED